MKYEIVELADLSGHKATIYSVIVNGGDTTLFHHFVEECKDRFPDEVEAIINRLYLIGHKHGAREVYFKDKEGKPGDGVCALYDEELRVFCIRYGTVAIILGGGGHKPVGIRAWQDDPKLKQEAETMIELSKDIMQRLKDGEINWSSNGMYLLGNLNFSNDE